MKKRDVHTKRPSDDYQDHTSEEIRFPDEARCSFDYYRCEKIAARMPFYPILLHGTPLHSHSIVPGGFDVTS